eukprot:CAMPEP_0194180558 /NCGR_PEP_ID=MMETSP0154-20130528/16985_1 /TAXON_ID=1049557 /ORGANISM="Thalassiothrix antarctica, Strain L6-D1" /LENGTH=341 /DNA_ID=CAMNT_0038896275 /DNA_START=8 /DNA_END=1030 /DNA_ORIENTATION=+
MKFAIISLTLIISNVIATSSIDISFKNQLLQIEFDSWAGEHGKKYEKNEDRKDRFGVWRRNHEFIENHNNQVPPPSYTLGHNQFSDMTHEEFKEHFHLNSLTEDVFPTNVIDSSDETVEEVVRSLKELGLPDYVNWVAAGAVTPVKDQASCGSCWAFSTTGALEGAKAIKTGELVALSEQNLLDCDHTDMGCNGGLMDNAFKFDEKSGGLCSEADYPYLAKRSIGGCNMNCTDVPGSIVKSFVDVPSGNARALLAAIAMQPISIAIQAGVSAFQFYKKGVLDNDKCGAHGGVDHGVLAVGYGTDLETQTPYWLVKNSWGDKWGEDGYLRMARNSTNEFGMC